VPGRVLVARAPTWVMNPTLPRDSEFIAEQYARDPAWARGEYGAEWRDDIEGYISLDVVRSCVVSGVRERPFAARHTYHVFVDAAGGSGTDSYTMAIAHKEGDRVLIDAVREARPPFSPTDITAEFARLVKGYQVRWVRGDAYAGDWVADAWRQHGIGFRKSDWTKSQLYVDLLPLLNAAQIVLLDDDRAVNQITGLERRVKFGSRSETIDHPDRGHDDVANVIAGAAVTAWHSKRTIGNAVPGLDDMFYTPRPPRVILGYPKSKSAGSPTYVARRPRNPATREDLHTIKEVKIKVGPHGHYIQPHGGLANDGRQKFAVMSPDESILMFAWGEEEARQAAMDIADGLQVSARGGGS